MYGPVGLIHLDAHTDTAAQTQGVDISHGTPLYRAVQEGLLDCKKVVQLGLRGSADNKTTMDFGLEQVHEWTI